MDSTSQNEHSRKRPESNRQQSARAAENARLPVLLTSFVGRDDELTLAEALFSRPDVRLITLTGPGGIGKTRLAIEIGHRVESAFSGGIHFVPLAAIQDHSLVENAIASRLGLREPEGAAASGSIISFFGESRSLLVVDNFEHILLAGPVLSNLLA